MVPPTNAVERNQISASTFEAFHNRWLMDQEHYLQELLRFIQRNTSSGSNSIQENEVHTKDLINQVLDHYVEYYKAKARLTREDVFLTLTPPWLTPFERTYLWMGGFRTGVVFRIMTNNVSDLTEDQSARLNALMSEIKEEEQRLTDELTRIQNMMASEAIIALARNLRRPRNGEVTEMESAFERLKTLMEDLVQSADLLRRKTISKFMETLKPYQTVKFLAAVTQLVLRLRRLGVQRDAQIQRRDANPQTHN